MVSVILYKKEDCEDCKAALKLLEGFQQNTEFDLIVIPIEQHRSLQKKYGSDLPVVKIGPYTLSGDISEQRLKVALQAAIDRDNQLVDVDDQRYQKRIKQGHTFSRVDSVSLWISKYLMHMITFFLAVYVGLPFLAPVLLKNGQSFPAKVIYTIYSPLCHQLAFRSWFIFGEQPFYPRELAGLEGLTTYEELINSSTINLAEARQFTGNEVAGFKVALCERDIAIYATLLLFSAAFVLTGKCIKKLPWYLWILIGILPIGLDGVSQLPGLAISLPDWIFLRESTPLLRTVTGALFGITTAWYMFPLIDEGMRETRSVLEEKRAYDASKSRAAVQ